MALDWKWLFIYPAEGVATVNRLVIPAGQPVHLSLTSATVMQSILMPRLAGQIYAMAGMRTQLNFAADAPGNVPWARTCSSTAWDSRTRSSMLLHWTRPTFAKWLAETKAQPEAGWTPAASTKRCHTGPSTVPHPLAFGAVDP